MWLELKILFFLLAVNFAPPLLSHFLEDRWNAPLDGGRNFLDGRPLFGPHKTLRGTAGAVVVGTALGPLLGFTLWIGFSAAVLSMAGDLLSSFIKRRLGRPSGTTVAGLDQVFEGLFPFFAFSAQYPIGCFGVAVLVAAFSVTAWAGSFLFKHILLSKPHEAYPRRVRSRVRLRELRACQIRSNPWHRLINFEDAILYHLALKSALQLVGAYERGKRNARDVRLRRLIFHFSDLPGEFDGYTLLFLSDLHLDGLEGLTERLVDIVSANPTDLCLLGGDYRMENVGPFNAALDQMARLIPRIAARDGILSVLGNHDCTEILDPLEKQGVRFLINDAHAVERSGAKLWIAGVDDPHYFQCDDLELATSLVPPGEFMILLAHTPEIYKKAARRGCRLYLCGHTHAGQIQLPKIGPLFTHSRAPRFTSEGVWYHGGMVGFTTAGAGVSGTPVRFRTFGEVVHITLRRRNA